MNAQLRERIEAVKAEAARAMTQTEYTAAGEKAIRLLPEIIAALSDEAGPEAVADCPCVEADGCPTEKAVLQRFWRAQQPAGQRQEGAVVAEINRRYDEMVAADWDKSERVDAIKQTLRSLRDFAASPPTEPASLLLVSSGYNGRMSHLTWLRNEADDLLAAVRKEVFAQSELDEDGEREARGIRDELVECGCWYPEGDPPLFLFRVASPTVAPVSWDRRLVGEHNGRLLDLDYAASCLTYAGYQFTAAERVKRVRDWLAKQGPSAALAAPTGVDAIPLNDETRWIFGQFCFQVIGITRTLRRKGMVIKKRAEDEQAAAIHWMLNLYLQHGDNWRSVADAYLRSDDAALAARDEGAQQ